MDTCSRCGKAVYFAERKTSLGRHWHPNCLRCLECNKILAPGQHAEHKGMPYCHKPCYGALFGPQMFGYGSNVTSPANFRKSGELPNGSQDTSFDSETPDGLKCIFKTSNTSPGPMKLQRNSIGDTPPPPPQKVYQKRNSAGSIDSYSSSSGYSSNESTKSVSELKPVSENNNDSGLKCVYQSSADQSQKASLVARSKSDAGNFVQLRPHSNKVRGAELFKRVQSYNEHHQNKRGQTLSITEDEGNVRISGPLRIYWGLKKPIILQHCDKKPAVSIPKRHSVIADKSDLQSLPEVSHESTNGSPTSPRKSRLNLGLDDSVISSPSSDVVMRRTNIKKSNTVAYRGDRPNKWKRASINGHIYNYDTSVFTPVLGSCTCVTVDNKMTVSQVIKTLLEKFMVENQPDEYHLCIITEQEGEKLLKDSDIPLLERLVCGPTDSIKIFIRDRPDTLPTVNPAHIPDDSSPTTETPMEEMALPEEVEQLMNIPEPVLRGLLDKFKQDEEKEVRRLKAKYERIRRRVRQIIEDKKANSSRC
ncbi:ras association domain-containing protein 4-like [Mercenaria mercenaria]|uniref:ras association domain-containing protein 4-like n=1 Tax=Mercenaria mercenaria TaxID=6596 RepID=UPI00234F13E8|nr:ras association domain-containing protein 4-like [Mercenaria mercenaria]